MKMSALERAFKAQLEFLKIPYSQEHRFHDTRKWRFDFAIPEHKIGIEIEGGIWSNGRHTRGAGYEKDCEKYNHAALAGWRVLRLTPSMVRSGQAMVMLGEVLNAYR